MRFKAATTQHPAPPAITGCVGACRGTAARGPTGTATSQACRASACRRQRRAPPPRAPPPCTRAPQSLRSFHCPPSKRTADACAPARRRRGCARARVAHREALAYARPSASGTRRSLAPRNIISGGTRAAPSASPASAAMGETAWRRACAAGVSGSCAPSRVATVPPPPPRAGMRCPNASTKHQSGMSPICVAALFTTRPPSQCGLQCGRRPRASRKRGVAQVRGQW